LLVAVNCIDITLHHNKYKNKLSGLEAALRVAAALFSHRMPSDGVTNYSCAFILIEMQIIREEFETLLHQIARLKYCVIELNRLVLAVSRSGQKMLSKEHATSVE